MEICVCWLPGTQHGAYQQQVKNGFRWRAKVEKEKNLLVMLYCMQYIQSPDGGYTGAGFCNSWRSNFIIQRKPNQGSADWNSCIIGDMSVAGFYDITPAIGGGIIV